MLDNVFWKNVLNAWINVQTKEEQEQTKSFAQLLAQKENNSKKVKVKSIFDELFGEEN